MADGTQRRAGVVPPYGLGMEGAPHGNGRGVSTRRDLNGGF